MSRKQNTVPQTCHCSVERFLSTLSSECYASNSSLDFFGAKNSVLARKIRFGVNTF